MRNSLFYPLFIRITFQNKRQKDARIIVFEGQWMSDGVPEPNLKFSVSCINGMIQYCIEFVICMLVPVFVIEMTYCPAWIQR